MCPTTYLSREIFDEIVDHCQAEYPLEACGILLGTSAPRQARVTDIVRAKNIKRSSVRYEIEPSTLHRAHFTAEIKGLEVVGFYHSHPDLPSEPSEYDAEHALSGQIYLIVSLQVKGRKKPTAWRWSSEVDRFLKEELVIQP